MVDIHDAAKLPAAGPAAVKPAAATAAGRPTVTAAAPATAPTPKVTVLLLMKLPQPFKLLVEAVPLVLCRPTDARREWNLVGPVTMKRPSNTGAIKTQDVKLVGSPGLGTKAGSSPPQDFLLQQDNLLDHLVSADAREDEAETSEQHREAELDRLEPERWKKPLELIRQAAKRAVGAVKRPETLPSDQQLATSFEDIVQGMQPSHGERARRLDTLELLGGIVERGVAYENNLQARPYGSYVSNVYSPGGDLDVSIEGYVMRKPEGEEHRVPTAVALLDKEEKVQLLKALSQKLVNRKLVAGRIQRILHARVPILKLTLRPTGQDCDISVGSTCAIFKSTVVGLLGDMDPRFRGLLRLVKLWSRAHNLNDATAGTFNSFALSLMVIFYLQTRRPSILPPICSLFQQAPDAVEERPLHLGHLPDPSIIEGCQAAAAGFTGVGDVNKAGLPELLRGFLHHWTLILRLWSQDPSTRVIRASTWAGDWTVLRWSKAYAFGVEDPFDATENCARSILARASAGIVKKFQTASDLLTASKVKHGQEVSLEEVLRTLFEGPEAPGQRVAGRQRPPPFTGTQGSSELPMAPPGQQPGHQGQAGPERQPAPLGRRSAEHNRRAPPADWAPPDPVDPPGTLQGRRPAEHNHSAPQASAGLDPMNSSARPSGRRSAEHNRIGVPPWGVPESAIPPIRMGPPPSSALPHENLPPGFIPPQGMHQRGAQRPAPPGFSLGVPPGFPHSDTSQPGATLLPLHPAWPHIPHPTPGHPQQALHSIWRGPPPADRDQHSLHQNPANLQQQQCPPGMEEPLGLGSHILQKPLADFCLRQLPLATLAKMRTVSKAICYLLDHETGHIWLEAAGSLTFIDPSCLPHDEDGAAVQTLLSRQGKAIPLMSDHPAEGPNHRTLGDLSYPRRPESVGSWLDQQLSMQKLHCEDLMAGSTS
ncbi:hypothetical protein WJX84_008113 [Apatococcus fuscideae]|uniref:Poly(A) RNA polymerase mitochondrial-like central palm domain-containing protein n=1 Tax=Apatococcus fuscideae TaxID=2026836 RepID=A0AAW1T0S7_9CHLO